MTGITFEQMPEAISRVLAELSELKGLLKQQKELQGTTPSDHPLTIQQAAELLKLSVPTIYGLVHRAEIPHSKKGKRLYFNNAELLEWIQSGRRKTTAEIVAEAVKGNGLNR